MATIMKINTTINTSISDTMITDGGLFAFRVRKRMAQVASVPRYWRRRNSSQMVSISTDKVSTFLL